MSAAVPVIPKMTFTNAAGPLIGGKVFVYIAGTSTPISTWQDSARTILNTNPIILDGRGQSLIWLDPSTAVKMVVQDANGVTQYTADNVVGSGSAPTLQQSHVDRFSGNGTQTAFTLSSTPGSINDTSVYVGSAYQQKLNYSIAGNVLTFSTAPASGTNNIEVNYWVLLDFTTLAATIAGYSTAASNSANAAAGSAAEADAAANAAVSTLNTLKNYYMGALASDPATLPDGSALVAGVEYFNTTSNITKVYNGATFQAGSDINMVNLAAPGGAGLVGTIASGTGAVARTVQAKEREVVSVTDFAANGVSGAPVDPAGVVDSTLGIQAAMNTGAGVVLFPHGTYKTTDRLTLQPNQELRGERSTIVNTASASPSNIVMDGRYTLGSHYAINATTVGGTGVTTTTASDAGNFAVGDYIVLSAAAFGQDYFLMFVSKVTAVDPATGIITLDEKVRDASYTLVHKVSNILTSIKISGFIFSTATDTAIFLKGARNVTITDNYYGDSISINGTSFVACRNLRLTHNTYNGCNAGFHSTVDSTFAFNTVRKGNVPLEAGCNGVKVMGNTIIDGPQNYVDLTTYSYGNEIIGNTFVDVPSAVDGIHIDQSSYGLRGENIITGNRMRLLALSTGIGMAGTSNNIITGNVIDGGDYGMIGGSNVGNIIGNNSVLNQALTPYDLRTDTTHLPIVSFGSAIPTTGRWAQGDICYNTAPASAGTPGWVCVTSGIPGTWKAMASVAA